MHGWLGDAEEPRHVGLCGRTAVDVRVGVDEREILSLSRAELLSRITFRSIHQQSSIMEGLR